MLRRKTGIRVRGFWSSIIQLVILLVVLFSGAITWVVNIAQLASCDWDGQKSWKGEIIHGIGVIPYASLVTVWFPDK